MSSHAGKRRKAGATPVTEARRYEAFGRVMAALATEAELMEACRDLTWWRGTGQGWHIEWREGPYASEVAAVLIAQVHEPAALAGQPTHASAALRVMGVSVALRAIDPLGRERLPAGSGLWRMAAALDTPGHTSSRRPWEELLGG
jgi:hypothetical protein